MWAVPPPFRTGLRLRPPGLFREAVTACGGQGLVAEVLAGLATDTSVYLSRREEARKVDKLTFIIRTADSSWHPGLPGRPLFPPGLFKEAVTGCGCQELGFRVGRFRVQGLGFEVRGLGVGCWVKG